MTGTALSDSTSQVKLATYGTGNPFSIGSGVSIVNSHRGQTAIYGNASSAWTLTNAGTVGGGKGSADSEHSIGNAGGLGVRATGILGLTNSGRIAGGEGGAGYYIGGNGGGGVSIGAGGTLTNIAGATIAGGAGTAGLYNGGNGGYAVSVAGFATITNQAGATITGGVGGRARDHDFSGAGTGGTGIVLTAGGSVSNAGTITGGAPGGGNKYAAPPSSVGVLFEGSANSTLTNSGTIAGIGGKAVQFGGGNDRLILSGGSVLSGGADGGSGRNVLELERGGSPGTVDGIGTALTDFQTIVVDAGARWNATGATKLAAGSALVVNGSLTLGGAVVGQGAIDIGARAAVTFKGAVGPAGTVAFTAKSGALRIADTASFKAAISGFARGDRIDIDSAAFKFGKGEKLTFIENAAGTGGTLALKNGGHRVALHLFGQYVAQGFHLAKDGHGGTLIAYRQPAVSAAEHLAAGGHG